MTDGESAWGTGLASTESAIAEVHDLIAFDLDGVVYVGPEAVPHAADSLQQVRERGARIAFVTNNAARTPQVVAEHLRSLGVAAEADDVVNSAQAAARLLAEKHPEGSRIYVIGGEGLFAALRDRGLEPVSKVGDDPVAVVSGYAPDLPWERVRDGAILVAKGLPWVATNTDASVPTPYGRGPGNGVLVGVVAEFAGVEPVVAGKPERALLDETVERIGASRPMFVGDRAETDIDGAHASGMPGLLVLTGVSDLDVLLQLESGSRPEYVGVDLRCLTIAQRAVSLSEDLDSATCGDIEVRHSDRWELPDGTEDEPASMTDLLRAVVALGWARLDADEQLADTAEVSARLGVRD